MLSYEEACHWGLDLRVYPDLGYIFEALRPYQEALYDKVRQCPEYIPGVPYRVTHMARIVRDGSPPPPST